MVHVWGQARSDVGFINGFMCRVWHEVRGGARHGDRYKVRHKVKIQERFRGKG